MHTKMKKETTKEEECQCEFISEHSFSSFLVCARNTIITLLLQKHGSEVKRKYHHGKSKIDFTRKVI